MIKSEDNQRSIYKLIKDDLSQTNLWGGSAPSDEQAISNYDHFVQFYDSSEFLINTVSSFIGAGIAAGDDCIVVARGAYRKNLEDRLKSQGLRLNDGHTSPQYLFLDADETLAKLMVNGMPQAERFENVIGRLIKRSIEHGKGLRVFGEMVAILWAKGQYDAAIHLEELWNDVHGHHSFSLFCAYPMSGFEGDGLDQRLKEVCERHSHVIPTEGYTTLTTNDDRLREIAVLQQKARSLELEIAERKLAEESLHKVKNELEVQVEDLCRLHELSIKLTRTLELEVVLQEVLSAALSVQNTDLGLLSLYDAPRGGLNLKVQRGFDEAFLNAVEWVPKGAGACGTCLEQQQRIIVEDVELDPIFVDYREAGKAAGFRAVHSTPLMSRDGNIIGVLSAHFRQPHRPTERECRLMDLYARMAADIIENARLHKIAQQELQERQNLLAREQQARREAEEANRLKDEFLATLSHELRNPLNSIVGNAEILLRLPEANIPVVRQAAQVISRNALAQSQLINDLLDLSRLQCRKLTINRQAMMLAPVISDAVESVRAQAAERQISLALEVKDWSLTVDADAVRIQQIVWNLLSNAVKFTPNSGSVNVIVTREDGQAIIKVQDTGQGIEPEFMPYVFEMFRQADARTTRKHGGLGIGLALVKELTELQGGTIEVRSDGIGRGACFTVALPLITVNQQKSKSLSKVPNHGLSKAHILIVDDTPDTVDMLRILFEGEGAKVQATTNAQEALKLAASANFDLILSDISMPEIDGYELLKQLRAYPNLTETPAIALTGFGREEDVRRAIEAGFTNHITKPLDFNYLIELTRSIAAERE